jgi:hypothetical protein
MKKKSLPKSKARNAYDLLSEIATLIVDEPRRYNQNVWIAAADGNDFAAPRGLPACGTVGCVAGWVRTLKGAMESGTTSEVAQRVLGINDIQVCQLFSAGAIQVSANVQTKAYAKAGAAHIRRFQAKHAAQLKAKAV